MKVTEENINKAIITTKFVINMNSPIVYVRYDEDGDWQFFGSEEVEDSDAMVLSMQQILKHDPTLSLIPDLKKGQAVSRMNINEPWKIEN